jgi:hypothetical protein
MGAYESAATQAFGDFDGNRRVDLADMAGFQLCFKAEAANPSWLNACTCVFDFDRTKTIDLHDLARFKDVLTGP